MEVCYNAECVERSPLAKAAAGLLAAVGNSTRRVRIPSLSAKPRFGLSIYANGREPVAPVLLASATVKSGRIESCGQDLEHAAPYECS